MISTQYINLNMVPSGVMPVLHCSQYDVGRPLGVVIYNGSESVDLSGYTVTIEGTRTDRTPVTAGVTTDDNIGVFTTTPTMTNENDTYRAKVVLTDNAGRVSSLAFVMCVDEKTMDENAEEIEEDASLYQQYTGTVQTIIAQIRGDLAAEITARQNAISAEASARQAADNTLQSNINAEASTRATQDASLQSQINQLIAPSGSAPSAAEVENARIGSDGTVYPTLGDAIRTQNSLLKSQLAYIAEGAYQSNVLTDLMVQYIGHYTISTDGTMNVNASYDTYVIDTTVLRSFKVSGATIKIGGYYAVMPSVGTVAYDNTRHLDIHVGDVTVPTECNYLALCILTGETAITAYTGQRNIKGDVSALMSGVRELQEISIEGYEREKTSIGTVVDGSYVNASGAIISLATTAYKVATVSHDKWYTITGVASTGGRLYVCKDASNNVVDVFASGSNRIYTDFVYNPPVDGVTLYVNTVKSLLALPDIYEIGYSFVKNESANVMGVQVSDDVYNVEAGDYVYNLDLHGSYNGTFRYESLTYQGAAFKNVFDDITPVVISTVGNVGANHGYAWVYSCTIATHGYTASDIGKTYTDGSNTWVLMQITDTNTVIIGCYDSTVWFRLKRTPPTTVNFGGGVKTVSVSSLAQFYPSVKNTYSSVLRNTAEKFVVLDEYDIINIGTGIDAIITNVGNNNNDSVAVLADSIMRVRCVYEFRPNGSCTVYSNWAVKKTDLAINYLYAGTQSMPMSASDRCVVPQTLYKIPTAITGNVIEFARTSWDDETVPPQIYIQLNSNTPTKAFITGYVNVDGRNADLLNSAGNYGASGKMYPYYVQPGGSAYDSYKVINTIAYRIPTIINEVTGVDMFAYCYINDAIYVVIFTSHAINTVITVPKDLRCMNAEVVMSDGLTVGNTVITNELDLYSTGLGSTILKFT